MIRKLCIFPSDPIIDYYNKGEIKERYFNPNNLFQQIEIISLTDKEIEDYIRSKSETAYHPSCTLKMGTDDMAVVDEKLKIHGLQNIRVADASVMPEITSGNLNAPTLMIGERASDFILNS